jgi:tetratricopeptide (TPR) repeat protein
VRAEALVRSGHADPALVARVQALRAEIRQEEADQRMVARLEEIRLDTGGDWVWQQATHDERNRAFERAFRDYGLPILDLTVEEAARRVAASSIRDTLVVALDHWAGGEPAFWHRLLPVARDVTSDRWRRQYFEARLKNDQLGLARLARQPEALDQPPAIIAQLAMGTNWFVDRRAPIDLLRRAQARHSADLWINDALAEFLYVASGPSEESVGFRRVALALRPESPILQHALGWELSRLGHHDEAIALLSRVRELRPNHFFVHYCLGEALVGKGRLDEGIRAYQEAARLRPQDPAVYQGLINALERKGAPAEAIASYLPAYKKAADSCFNNLHPVGLLHLADSLARWGSADDAITAYGRFIAFHRDLMEPRTRLVQLLEKTGRLDRAVAEWQDAVRRRPEDLAPYFPLGVVLEKKGRLNEAADLWRQAARLRPNHETHAWLGEFLAKAEKPDEAVAAFRESLRLEPYPGTLLGERQQVAALLEKAHRRDEAIAAWRDVVRLVPGDAAAAEGLCGLLDRAGRREEALAAFRAAEPRQGWSAHPGWSYQTAGGRFENEGRPDLAIALYREGVRAHPTDALLHNALAWALARKGSCGEAAAAYREVIRLQLANDVQHWNLAVQLLGQGGTDQAIAVCQEALRGAPRSSLLHTALADALAKRGDHGQAAAAYREALRHRADRAPVRELLGGDLPAGWKPEEAMVVYRAALGGSPGYAFDYASLAETLARIGETARAIAAWREVTRHQPGYTRGFQQLAALLAEAGELEEVVRLASPAFSAQQVCDQLQVRGLLGKGVAACRRCIGQRPEEASPRAVLGVALERQARPEEAVAAAGEWVRAQPRSVEALLRRAELYQRLGSWEEALVDLSHATEVDPSCGPAWGARATQYARLRRWDKAVADYSKLLELNPQNAAALSGRGDAHFQLRQWDEAAEDYTRLVAMSPSNSSAWLGRGAARSNAGRYAGAVEDYTRAIEASPAYGLAWHNRGLALARLSRWDRAAADHARALELVPLDDWKNDLAWLLATCPEPKVRNPARAVALAQQAADASPKVGTFWNTLGVARYRAGDFKGAVEALDKSVALRQGGDPFDWLFLAMAHEKRGQHDEAHKYYDRAAQWLQEHEAALAKDKPQADELRRFRDESEETLGMKKR